ncbi:hypothetical protein EDB89DRAFT_2113863 [Lactarius sanguifluus]|nr:hypothetical protein EDB89DRAFT_2113863 [Lactarius sanguifluus]
MEVPVRDRYNDIAEHGYRLHPRYDPRWEPSWFKTGKDFYTADDRQVTVMRVLHSCIPYSPYIPAGNRRNSHTRWPPEHSGQRDNHCAPLLDVIKLPAHFGSQQLMVFPSLRPVNQPRFQTFGDDCTANNIMFDPSQMYPNWFHPVKIDRSRNFKGTAKAYTRTQRPRRYYFINFGLSRQYTSRDSMDGPLRGGDESAPEHRSGQHCNPFHTDIYYIGNLVRQEFMKKCNGFEFMEDLIASMTQVNPIERPPIEDVLQEFSRIRASLSKRKLLTAIKSKSTPKVLRIIRQAGQSVWQTRLTYHPNGGTK